MSEERSLSPQGYIYDRNNPENPFWSVEEDHGSVTATADVDNNTGTPEVVVTRTQEGLITNFDFSFKNLKGAQGAQGEHGVQGEQGEPGKRFQFVEDWRTDLTQADLENIIAGAIEDGKYAVYEGIFTEGSTAKEISLYAKVYVLDPATGLPVDATSMVSGTPTVKITAPNGVYDEPIIYIPGDVSNAPSFGQITGGKLVTDPFPMAQVSTYNQDRLIACTTDDQLSPGSRTGGKIAITKFPSFRVHPSVSYMNDQFSFSWTLDAPWGMSMTGNWAHDGGSNNLYDVELGRIFVNTYNYGYPFNTKERGWVRLYSDQTLTTEVSLSDIRDMVLAAGTKFRLNGFLVEA
ncbi:MAG: hypothetical protein IKE94_04635 [Aeriscardovia sp.]|nr:hypothetical protein [Aeriscardovia sp.]